MEHIELTRQRFRPNIERMRQALVEARAAENAIQRFIARLEGAARARRFRIGESEMLRFALEIMLSLRRAGARRYLRRSQVDAAALQEFLAFAGDLSTNSINGADDPDQLADMLTSALDDLHAYLLANDLVEKGYLEAERTLARALADNDDEGTVWLDSLPARASRETATGASEHNLALAG